MDKTEIFWKVALGHGALCAPARLSDAIDDGRRLAQPRSEFRTLMVAIARQSTGKGGREVVRQFGIPDPDGHFLQHFKLIEDDRHGAVPFSLVHGHEQLHQQLLTKRVSDTGPDTSRNTNPRHV